MSRKISPENILIVTGYKNDETSKYKEYILNQQKQYSSFNSYFLNYTQNIFIADNEQILNDFDINFKDKVKKEELLKNDFILFIHKNEEEELILLDARLNPEIEYNWTQVFTDFLDNLLNTESDKNGLYKWGQVVQATGEYICVDCGLVVDFKEGEIFPICEVCLSGDPSAPDSKSNEGYWERI